MIKRTIEISQNPAHLTVRLRQLVLLSREPGRTEPIASIPCEDIGVLLVEHAGSSYTHAALTALLEHDAAVVICGRDHLPAGLLLPLNNHSQTVWRVQAQIAAPRPVRKRLWRDVVRAKIRAQAANLRAGSAARSRLLRLARGVRSGDPDNVEAQAAQLYWGAWLDGITAAGLDRPFRRNPDLSGINALLNYGYAVVRAAVARSIVAAGLIPVIGIHHSNRSNSFCLADDLVEPLRPLVDRVGRSLIGDDAVEFTTHTKAALLGVLTCEVRTGEQSGPLLVALPRYVASFVRVLTGEARELTIPQALEAPWN